MAGAKTLVDGGSCGRLCAMAMWGARSTQWVVRLACLALVLLPPDGSHAGDNSNGCEVLNAANFCTGACDASEAFEFPLGVAQRCDPFG